MVQKQSRWAVHEKGQALVEYGLVITFVAIAVIGSLIVFGGKVRDLFSGVLSAI